MRIEIEIITPPDTRERHRCWETAVPRVFQTIVGEQIINVHVDRENVCEFAPPKNLAIMDLIKIKNSPHREVIE